MHPSIPVGRENLRVAEIGAGTGYVILLSFYLRYYSSPDSIWLIDLARYLPPSAIIEGFDIIVSQCPPKDWLPANVSIHQLDCLAPLPANLIEQYDIVHIQLFQLGIQNREPGPIIQNLIRMLSSLLSLTILNLY